jgi:hypothetical protein
MPIGLYGSNYWYRLDQAWDQSRAAISQQFADASSLVNSAMTDAMSNQISGMANLAAQAALKRIRSKTAAVSSQASGVIATAQGSTATTANSGSASTAKSSSVSSASSTSSAVPRFNRFA